MTGLVARHRPNHPNDDFSQPGLLFRKSFDDQSRQTTIKTIAGSMKGIPRDVQERAIKNFFKSDP